jgi:hypothetical protein
VTKLLATLAAHSKTVVAAAVGIAGIVVAIKGNTVLSDAQRAEIEAIVSTILVYWVRNKPKA